MVVAEWLQGHIGYEVLGEVSPELVIAAVPGLEVPPTTSMLCCDIWPSIRGRGIDRSVLSTEGRPVLRTVVDP